uniref:Hypothetical chloroplast RF38 n=1 Tax=Dasya binghamiae TaxID=1896963 RepID=A0A1C8XRZ8_9FLOR|nr:hypothetical chloroplast RF38 [Dasya binghamiae]AOH77271.1 hypothetical chloroplast RF38 [Dasya binghamiae]
MIYKNSLLHPYKTLKPNYKIKIYYINKYIWIEIKALIKRLYIQTYRRPSIIFAGIIQPLLWLILFGSLFKNAPINLLGHYNLKYSQFLSYGIIVFTAFTSSINAGLPIIFDREFGFLNRLFIAPLIYKNSLFVSVIIYTLSINIIEVITIIIFSINLSENILSLNLLFCILNIITLLIINIATLSVGLSFIVTGHIEFLACTLIINLPTLFSSTALAPLSFMPPWLQIIACINPLTYSIEIIRYISLNKLLDYNINIIKTIWFSLNIKESIFILLIINILTIIIIKKILQYKYN